MNDFFISYNKADKSWAEWIAWQLEEADYTTVLQAWDFGTGSNFVLEMQKAAAEASRTIAVLSPDYLTSNFTAPEWAAAFAQDPTGSGRKLIPIRVRKCEPAGLLGPIVYQNLVGLDERAAREALFKAVKRGRSKPATPPAFPPAAGRAVTSQPRYPGSLPPIWNVPHLRNPNFTGREDLLKQIRESLTSGKHAALTQAMHGLGGVGKTQAAIEYTYRYASEYDAVLWVPAEDQATLASHFAALSYEIGLEVGAADQPTTIDTVKRWLRDQSHWLLVFDNAESTAILQPYLPQRHANHVIITSRNPEWRTLAKPLEVQHFTGDESVEFLLKRTGSDASNQNERAAAATLADELAGLALALEQASAYAETHALSLTDYLRLFREHRERVLSAEPSPDYPHTIETVWSISVGAVRQASPAAAELLTLLAFVAPDVPLSLVQSGAGVYSGALAASAHDELEFREILRTLRRHSLVKLEGVRLSVHRVVQSVTRRSLPDTARRTWANVAMQLVESALPDDPNNVAAWPIFSDLTSHVDIAAQHCEAEVVGLEIAVDCLNQTARYLNRRADYKSSRSYLERAIRLAERQFGPHHPSVAVCLNNLGLVHQALERLDDARTAFERALQIDEDAFGPNHLDVARDAHNLAGLQHVLGDSEGARANYQRALEIVERVHGPNHPIVALNFNNLGIIAQDNGDMTRARENYERALKIDEAVFGPNHPNVARDLSNLGTVLHALGDLPGALAAIERGLAIDEAVFGPSHHTVAIRLNNLAHVQEALGDNASAQKNRVRARQIDGGRSGHSIMNIAYGV